LRSRVHVPLQEALIGKAFSNWSRQNHRTFVAACERHGRKNREAIYAEVAELADKDVAQVKRYFKTFFERYQELSDWRRLMERIEKGEQKIKVRHGGGGGARVCGGGGRGGCFCVCVCLCVFVCVFVCVCLCVCLRAR
jgi:hypothetical protein